MKKMLVVMLSLLVIWNMAYAEETLYETRTLFNDIDPIMNVISTKERLYTVRDSGIFVVNTDTSEDHIAKTSDYNENIHTFISDGDAVYGVVANEALSIFELINANGTFVNRLVFETNAYQGGYIQNPVIFNDIFYFSYISGTDTTLVLLSLGDGEMKELHVNDMQCFDVMHDGQLIALKREVRWPNVIMSLVTIACDTGEETYFAPIDTTENLKNLTYDSDTETVYLFGRSELYAAKKDDTLKYIDHYIAGDVIATTILNNTVALVVDGALVIRNLSDAGDAQSRQLTILESYGRGETYRIFLEENPHIDLIFSDAGTQTNKEKFVRDMNTRNSDIDIYILSDMNLLKSIKEKHYYVDMAQNADIQNLIGTMYQPFQDVFTHENQIVAFPRETFFEVLCYHKPTFDSLSITPPTTYEAYFDFCLNWLDDYLDLYPDIMLNPFANGINLQSLLQWFTDEQSKNERPLQYQQSTLSSTLEGYQNIKKTMAEADGHEQGTIQLFYQYAIPLLDGESDYAYMALAFEEGTQVALNSHNGDFSYFVINPYSSNLEDALSFVAAFDQSRTASEFALLYQTKIEAIESEIYQSEKAQLDRRLTTMEEALLNAAPDMANEITQQITEQKELIKAYEATSRWAITKEAIAYYQNYVDYLFINTFNPVVMLTEDTPNLFKEDDDITIDALLNTLDQKVRMILSEEGI